MEPRWNPAGYLRNVVETTRVRAALRSDDDDPHHPRPDGGACPRHRRGPRRPEILRGAGADRELRAPKAGTHAEGFEAAQANCLVCHSVDYIAMQPPAKARPSGSPR